MNVWKKMVAVIKDASTILVASIAYVMLAMSNINLTIQLDLIFLTLKMVSGMVMCIDLTRHVSVSIFSTLCNIM